MRLSETDYSRACEIITASVRADYRQIPELPESTWWDDGDVRRHYNASLWARNDRRLEAIGRRTAELVAAHEGTLSLIYVDPARMDVGGQYDMIRDVIEKQAPGARVVFVYETEKKGLPAFRLV